MYRFFISGLNIPSP